MATETRQRPSIYSQQRPDPARLAYLHLMADRQDEEAKQVDAYREFYSGEHPTMLTQRQAAYLNVASDSVFSFNHCPIVVDSLVERLHVTGFTAGGDETLAEMLWQWWKANRMDGQQILAHTFAARDGASYVVVDWNAQEQRPGFHVNAAWDGESGMKVHWAGPVYPGQQILFASKRWRVEFEGDGRKISTYRRLNIYYPDRIEKYRSGASDEGNWEPFWDEGDSPDVWPLPWVDRENKPLGVPVIPFLNRQTGVSELRDVIPIQIAINKLLVDLLAAADVEGFGIFTKTGGAFVTSPEVFPGAFWQDTDPDSSWGKLPGAELGGLLATLDRLTQAVAVVTRRPLSYFTAQATTSGEHLKQMEAGLVSTAKAAQVTFGNSWEDVMRMGLRLAEEFAGEVFGEAATAIECEWHDPETRNDSEHTASVLAKVETGVIDDFQALKELGYDGDTVRAILVRKEIVRLRQLSVRPQAPAPVENAEEAEEEGEEKEQGTENGAWMTARRQRAKPTDKEAEEAEEEMDNG